MTLSTEIGRIPPGELDRIGAVHARRQSLELNPRAYSATESETILLAMRRVDAEIVAMFDIDEMRTWRFSSLNGAVWYEEE